MKSMKQFTALLLALALIPVTSMANEPSVVKNIIVLKEKDRFGGWPANHGIWNWGDEIVVGFAWGHHDDSNEGGHPIKGPTSNRQARSMDGGETWVIEELLVEGPDGSTGGDAFDCKGGIDFNHPDFAFKFSPGNARFYYSTNRAKTWIGPFKFPLFGRTEIMARTDYIINGKHDMNVFLTSPKDDGIQGWPFCARTIDGGKSWKLIGWIGPQPPLESYGYAIMPSTLRLNSGAFLSIIRRGGFFDGTKRWWLEAFISADDGKNWHALKEPYIDNFGNPAHMMRLKDGRIALTYGWRKPPFFGIRAKISNNDGVTWDEEFVVRGDGDVWDLGYPRTVQRLDGMCISVYYFKDKLSKERHIAATIWNPGLE